MIDQTTAVTINAEITGVDINDGQIIAQIKGGDSVRLCGIPMNMWLREFRYLVNTFEWRSELVQQEHKQDLERLQDSLADVLRKINAKMEATA